MSIVTACAKRILNSFPNIVLKSYGHANGKDGIILPDWILFEIEQMEPSLGAIAESPSDVLGTYTPMSSPGIITLHVRELTSFYWKHVARLYQKFPHMEWIDLQQMAHVVVFKTYFHEQFHHLADVCRHLFHGKYDKDVEEALAVAYSYYKMMLYFESNKKIKITELLYANLVEQIYKYHSPGYRDWVNYQRREMLFEGMVQYLIPHNPYVLRSGRISLSEILLEIHKVIEKDVNEELS